MTLIALSTALNITASLNIDLSIAGREPRGALDVSFDCHGQRLRVAATHLGLSPGERRQQARRLLALFDRLQADVSVLMGDLNEWFLWGRILRWLHAHFQATANYKTFPAFWPLLALDHIWVSPRKQLLLEVDKSRLARSACDRLPLKAVIKI